MSTHHQHHPHHLTPAAAPHAVTSPSPSRHRSEDAHAMLHNADATLAHERATLHRLQSFYEQHTFDTQGPYADLFAVLLSSCKHLIDVNTALVQQVYTQEATLHRQQATCDALCGEVAQHKADIVFLLKRDSRVPEAAGEEKRWMEDPSRVSPDTRRGTSEAERTIFSQQHHDCEAEPASVRWSNPSTQTAPLYSNDVKNSSPARAPSSSSSSASSSCTQFSQHAPPTRQDARTSVSLTREERNTMRTASHDHNEATLRATWVSEMEQRVAHLQEQLLALQQQQQQQFAGAASLALHHSEKERSRSASPASSSSSAQSEPDVTPLPPAQSNTQTVSTMMETLEQWKAALEDNVAERLEDLTQHVAAVERAAVQQRRQLRWLGLNAEDTLHDAPDGRPISRKKMDLSTEAAPSSSTPLPPPPLALTQWLKKQLNHREEEWRRVLEEVQDAVAAHTDASTAGIHLFPSDRATSAEETVPDPHDTALPTGTSASPHRAWFTRTLPQLLLANSEDARQQRNAVHDAMHATQQATDALRDLTARVEVLEVYAPHRYAIAAAPPVLGIELEDVREPRVGVRVRAVYQGYTADQAGLSVGDVIAGVGHHAVQTRAQLYVMLAELTRDYNAQCRVQIEEGYLRHYTAGTPAQGLMDTSVLTAAETSLLDEDDERKSLHRPAADGGGLDQALQRARTVAASARHRTGGMASDLKYRAASVAANQPRSYFKGSVNVSQHKSLLAQCLPYFELTLHVLRDGRLRDVTVLVPPSDALRSVTQY